MTILFVEDEGLIRISTAELLTQLGHVVLQAGDGAQALEILGASAVDVLMTDLGLPDMAGHRLAGEARQRRPGLPVIFASGSDAPAETGEHAIPHAVMLRKPYDAASLAQALEMARHSRRIDER
jgi:CheY-like chemotaxis protein